jgi:hypothetical protein
LSRLLCIYFVGSRSAVTMKIPDSMYASGSVGSFRASTICHRHNFEGLQAVWLEKLTKSGLGTRYEASNFFTYWTCKHCSTSCERISSPIDFTAYKAATLLNYLVRCMIDGMSHRLGRPSCERSALRCHPNSPSTRIRKFGDWMNQTRSCQGYWLDYLTVRVDSPLSCR